MPAVIAMLAILLAWTLVAGRLGRWNVTPAITMVCAGVALTAGSDPIVRVDIDNRIAERIVEVTLAVVLFVDATEVPRGILGREPRVTLGLVAIALPLSLVSAWLAGVVLLPSQDLFLLALLAVVVVPTALAPAVKMVRARRIPAMPGDPARPLRRRPAASEVRWCLTERDSTRNKVGQPAAHKEALLASRHGE